MTAPVVVVGVNSWVTIAQADDYFAAKYGADAWATLTVLQKTQLLLSAVRWILSQNTFDIAMTSTAALVKYAQCEAAWFIYRWFGEYEKRRALISSGVKSFTILDFSESLSDAVQFPAFLSDILADYSTVASSQFVNIHRDVEDNASE